MASAWSAFAQALNDCLPHGSVVTGEQPAPECVPPGVPDPEPGDRADVDVLTRNGKRFVFDVRTINVQARSYAGTTAETAGVRLVVDPNSTEFNGYDVRIRYSAPPVAIAAASYAAAGSETWTGPDRAIGIPVYYAAALCAMRKLDTRQDTNRYSTTQAQNGVTDQDIMAASQMWMGQFELELSDFDRPLPPARD